MTSEFVFNHCAVKLIEGECLTVIKESLADHIFDLIAVDLPYGTTQNKWDTIIPLDSMWSAFRRVLKPTGVVVLTATQPFSSQLVMSNLTSFKYDLIWQKSLCSGQLNVSKMPMRAHEHILVFYDKFNTYNEQKTAGAPYKIKRAAKYTDGCYGEQKESSKENDGYRHAKSIIPIPNPRIRNGHPTQKPMELMSYIVKTYSNPGDLVLDCCMGSGTTAEACVITGRNFVGIEMDPVYFKQAQARINNLSTNIFY